MSESGPYPAVEVDELKATVSLRHHLPLRHPGRSGLGRGSAVARDGGSSVMDLPTLSAAGCAVNQWPSNRGPGVRLLAVPLPALFVLGASHLKSRNHTACSPACRRKCKVPPEWLSQLSSLWTFSRTDILRDLGEVSQTPLRFPDSSTAWDRLDAN